MTYTRSIAADWWRLVAHAIVVLVQAKSHEISLIANQNFDEGSVLTVVRPALVEFQVQLPNATWVQRGSILVGSASVIREYLYLHLTSAGGRDDSGSKQAEGDDHKIHQHF